MKFRVFLLAGICATGFSCSSSRYNKVPYFTDLSGQSGKEIKKIAFHAPLIQPDDLISVVVQTADGVTASIMAATPPVLAVTTASFPSSVATAQTSSSIQPMVSNFLVSQNGDIEIPMLGKMHVAGLTTMAVSDSIRSRASVHLINPTVSVRFANFKINIMGEVGRPGTYVVPNEKVSVLDALSLAGDITIFGKKENVMLIRNSGDSSTVYSLNLNDKATFQSPCFYLQQNDIIYVEPGKTKLANLDGTKTRNFAIAASVLSVVIVLASRIN